MSPVLKTERLMLAPLSAEDWSWFADLNRHPDVRAHLWDNQIISDSQVDDTIHTSFERFALNGYGLWHGIAGDVAVGYYGLWHFFDEPQPQLLYVTDPEFARQGYATEAGQRICRYAFERVGLTYLDAAIDEANAASSRTALALGFSYRETRDINGLSTRFYRLDRPSPKG